MSQSIKDLLEKDKWEIQTLGEISTSICSGSSFSTKQLGKGNLPAIQGGDISGKLGLHFSECPTCVDESKIKRKVYFETGDILFMGVGNIDYVGSVSAYIGHQRGIAKNSVYVIKHRQNAKYIACALSTSKYWKQIRIFLGNTTLTNISAKNIRQIQIPLPPRHVQDLVGEFLYELIQSTTELSEKLKRENEDCSSI